MVVMETMRHDGNSIIFVRVVMKSEIRSWKRRETWPRKLILQIAGIHGYQGNCVILILTVNSYTVKFREDSQAQFEPLHCRNPGDISASNGSDLTFLGYDMMKSFNPPKGIQSF